MKTIIFREDFSPETTQALINEIEQPGQREKEHDIRILFSCQGGASDMAQAVEDCINELPESFNVELVVTYQACSSAFDLFVKAKCQKRLYDEANAIVHLYSRDVSAREVINSDDSYDKFLVEYLKKANLRYLAWLKRLDIFTPKELKRIAKGGDVYVERRRLQKIIDDQEESRHG
jgi:hypothetical protein